MDAFRGGRLGPFVNGTNLLLIHSNAFGADDVAEELYLALEKLAFR